MLHIHTALQLFMRSVQSTQREDTKRMRYRRLPRPSVPAIPLLRARHSAHRCRSLTCIRIVLSIIVPSIAASTRRRLRSRRSRGGRWRIMEALSTRVPRGGIVVVLERDEAARIGWDCTMAVRVRRRHGYTYVARRQTSRGIWCIETARVLVAPADTDRD
jgi:hypothetical protein